MTANAVFHDGRLYTHKRKFIYTH